MFLQASQNRVYAASTCAGLPNESFSDPRSSALASSESSGLCRLPLKRMLVSRSGEDGDEAGLRASAFTDMEHKQTSK